MFLSSRSKKQEALGKASTGSLRRCGDYRTAKRPGIDALNSIDHAENQRTQKPEKLVPKYRTAINNGRQRQAFSASRKATSVKSKPPVASRVDLGSCFSDSASRQEVSDESTPLVPDTLPPNQKKSGAAQRSTVSGKVPSRAKKENNLHQFMNSITRLKKGDQRKLAQLLEALKNIDSSDSSDNNSVVKKRYKAVEPTRTTEIGMKLNPKALAFSGTSSLSKAVPSETIQLQTISPPLYNPRVRPHVFKKECAPSEPIWQKTAKRLPPANRRPLSEIQNESRANLWERSLMPAVDYNFPDTWQNNYSVNLHHNTGYPYPPNFNGVFRSPWQVESTGFFTVPQTANKSFPDAWTYPMRPCFQGNQGNQDFSVPYGHNLMNFQWQTNFEGTALADLSSCFMPMRDEFGREALVRPGNQSVRILENFTRRFPLTGILKAGPQIPINNREAADIQQRLEYLLLTQKEMKAHGHLVPDVPKNNPESSKETSCSKLSTKVHTQGPDQGGQKQQIMKEETKAGSCTTRSLPSESLVINVSLSELEEDENVNQADENLPPQTSDSESDASTCVDSMRRASI